MHQSAPHDSVVRVLTGDFHIEPASRGVPKSSRSASMPFAWRRFVQSKFRLDRGPLRWWLIAGGVILVQYNPLRFLAGTVCVAAGAALHLIAKFYLRQSRSYLTQTQAPTTRGPYRFTRNPFYLGNLVVEAGLLVIVGRWEMALAYLIVWNWVYRATIRKEEQKLLGLCGERYAEYCARVPRLIPLPWKYLSAREASGPSFSWHNPNIIGGKEIERSLRLLSYPLLLRLAADLHRIPGHKLSMVSSSTLLCLGLFLAINVVGWCSTRLVAHPWDRCREKPLHGQL